MKNVAAALLGITDYFKSSNLGLPGTVDMEGLFSHHTRMKYCKFVHIKQLKC